ncbi:hypothetical protein MSBRW_1516 [Methanosarcina barkeri str. Wiesmoor]|uniref:Lipoprotein n=2 Tax=Methanosarcina barkeri TaxID=2208 RepID=A0A0E3QKR6_METBA|nr:hypothetical protein [Methanosarcina barkeri]AKB50769.1 hypothetical protein MSBRW_1516 [Methanosarcina barkeri str. Wiesmoor]
MSKKRILVVLLILAAFLSFGCAGKGRTNLSVSNNETEINVSFPNSGEGSWCPVGSQLQVKDPTTGKILSLTITGTEKFENKTLCKACLETGTEGNISRFEYMWSEDKNTTIWTKYGADGNISMRFINVDGKKTIIDGAGRTLEFGNSEEVSSNPV